MRTNNLESPQVAMLAIAVLIKRLGGSVKITQQDIAYNTIIENGYDGAMELILEVPEQLPH